MLLRPTTVLRRRCTVLYRYQASARRLVRGLAAVVAHDEECYKVRRVEARVLRKVRSGDGGCASLARRARASLAALCQAA